MTSLDTCGFEKLITICHGDAKPNNFLFRNINIEFDDLDLGEDLDCEGLQSILIDWQGGFVGSVANDLMWSIFPFLEANQDKKVKFIYSEKATKTSQKSLNCIWYFKNRWRDLFKIVWPFRILYT